MPLPSRHNRNRVQRPPTAPLELTPLYGRESDVAHICAQLEGRVRLLTLTGTAGSGKTRLAREVSRLMHTHGAWAGGSHFSDLRASSSSDDVVTHVAAALGVPLGDELSAPQTAEVLRRHLASAGRLLLVLDNAEHLLTDVRALVDLWLESAPDLVVLVTSREALGHPAETSHLVGPLSLPSHLDDALTTPAVQLFLRCAANLAVQVPTTEPELQDLVALVTRLDGNPLAIELAAARTPLLSAKAILSRMERRFDVLSQSTPRRVSLWDAINASWESLTRPEQRALMQLALFRGGASVEPFEALIHADSRYEGVPGLDLLGGLLRKSLATSTSSPTLPTERRVDLYESIRAFALERLAESPELQAELTGRYVDWCLSTLSRHAQHQVGANAHQMHLELASELTNLLAGLALATTSDAPPPWRKAAAEALVAGRRLMHGLVPLDRMERLVASATRAEGLLAPETRIRLSAVHANYLATLNDPESARATLETAVAWGVASGDPDLEGLALKGFSSVATYLAADTIIARLERALALLEAPRWRSDTGYAKAALGLVYARKREFERGDALFAEAASELSAPADAMALGWTLNNWGSTFALRGMWDRAREVLPRSLQIARHTNLRLLEAATLCGLGECELMVGNRPAARTLFADALVIARAAGYRRHGSVAAGYLAAIAHFDGDPATAVVRYDEALSMLGSEWDARLAHGLIVSARALALARLGQSEAADIGFMEAHAVLERAGDEALLAAHRVHRVAAEVALGRRSHEGALDEAKLIAKVAASQTSALRLSHVQYAISLLELIVAARHRTEPVGHVSIGPDTSFITLGDTSLDLRRSPKTRRLVALLVERRTSYPGLSVTVHDLFDAAWPDDRTPEPHRSNRVYVALTRLRNAGFGELILHDGDGYLLDPRVTIVGAEPA